MLDEAHFEKWEITAGLFETSRVLIRWVSKPCSKKETQHEHKVRCGDSAREQPARSTLMQGSAHSASLPSVGGCGGWWGGCGGCGGGYWCWRQGHRVWCRWR